MSRRRKRQAEAAEKQYASNKIVRLLGRDPVCSKCGVGWADADPKRPYHLDWRGWVPLCKCTTGMPDFVGDTRPVTISQAEPILRSEYERRANPTPEQPTIEPTEPSSREEVHLSDVREAKTGAQVDAYLAGMAG